MKLSLLGFAGALLLATSVSAQDVPLTQYLTSPLYLNPGLTGLSDPYDMRFAVNYRSQVLAVNQQPTIKGIASFDVATMQGKLPEGDALGIGFMGLYDQSASGGIDNVTAGFSFAYIKAIDRNKFHHLSLGLQAFVVQKHIDPAKVTQNDFYASGSDGLLLSPTQKYDNTDIGYTDANGGIVYSGEVTPRLKVEAGYAYYHLSKPQEVLLTLTHNINERQTEHLSATYNLSRKLTLNVNGLLQTQGGTTNMLAGSILGIKLDKSTELDIRNLKTRILYLGAWYHFNQAVAPYIGFEAQNFHFGFTYDISTVTGNSAGPNQGAYEISAYYMRRHRKESDKERENNYFRGRPSIY